MDNQNFEAFGIPSSALLDDLESGDGMHLCPLCNAPIEDPLEECPTCAAEYDAEEDANRL